MDEEEKGFVIKDKRSFDEKGDLKDKKPEEKKEEEKPEEQTPEDETKAPPLPEVNFSSLVFSLSSSAFFHLGEIEDPQTKEKRKDLPLAKQAIDTIAMLKEKTEGNLTEEEQKFVGNVLTDLRWRYVKASTSK